MWSLPSISDFITVNIDRTIMLFQALNQRY